MSARKRLAFDPLSEARRNWQGRGWDEAALGMGVVTSVIRADQILHARLHEVLRPMGLTYARYELLMLLDFARHGALPLGKIGERLQVHATSITNAVDRLERDGLVERQPHPDDGRTILATITAEGRELVGRATTELNAEVFAQIGLPDDELEQLFALLMRFRRSAGDFD